MQKSICLRSNSNMPRCWLTCKSLSRKLKTSAFKIVSIWATYSWISIRRTSGGTRTLRNCFHAWRHNKRLPLQTLRRENQTWSQNRTLSMNDHKQMQATRNSRKSKLQQSKNTPHPAFKVWRHLRMPARQSNPLKVTKRVIWTFGALMTRPLQWIWTTMNSWKTSSASLANYLASPK